MKDLILSLFIAFFVAASFYFLFGLLLVTVPDEEREGVVIGRPLHFQSNVTVKYPDGTTQQVSLSAEENAEVKEGDVVKVTIQKGWLFPDNVHSYQTKLKK